MSTGSSGGFDLSVGQRALWFLHRLAPDGSAYTVSRTVRVDAAGFDADRWRADMQGVIDRHPALRTRYVVHDGDPRQIVDDWQAADLDVVNGVSFDAEQVSTWARAEAARPFDLARGPVFRLRVLWTGHDYVVVASAHHIAVDMWSLLLLAAEIGAGTAPAVPAPRADYLDFVQWQKNWLASESAQRAWDYWRGQLHGDLPVLRMPQDRPRPPGRAQRGAQHEFTFDADLTAEIRRLARAEVSTCFVLLLAVYHAILHRYSGQDDIIVMSPVAGRTQRAFRATVGYFVNLMPLRASFDDRPTFREHLRRVRASVAGAIEHQDFPFPALVERLAPQRRFGEDPFMRAALTFQRLPPGFGSEGFGPLLVGGAADAGRAASLAGATVTAVNDNTTPVQADLTLAVVDSGHRLFASMQYNADIYDGATIERLCESMQVLLSDAVRAPDTAVDRLDVLSAAQRRRVVSDWNSTGADESDHCIHELVESQADRTPRTVAVSCGYHTLTYRGLEVRANAIAWQLISAGVLPGRRVVLCADRAVETVIGILGILKAGGCYVPLDAAVPTERLMAMLSDARPCAVLTGPAQRDLVRELTAELEPAPAVIVLDRSAGVAGRHDRPTVHTVPADPAYVIFTSGSTGRPKGTVNTHAGVVNHLRWRQSVFSLTDADRVLQKTPYTFDVSMWEIFLPLTVGARLVIAAPGAHTDPAYLAAVIRDQQITVVHFVPSMLDLFLDQPDLDCNSVRYVMCGGESLTEALQRRFFERFDLDLHLCYGPSETCIAATYLRCTRAGIREGVRIGRPVANTTIHLLDAHGGPVPIGAVGEIHIGGRSVGDGYLDNPVLTAGRFVADPFAATPGAVMFRTGDFGRFLPDGCIEFVGRHDGQIKLRGLRLELGDVETALRRHPGVRDVIVRPDRSAADPRLIAYVASGGSARPTVTELRRHTAALLPRYMVPAAFVSLDRFPLGPTGKVDLQRLDTLAPSDRLGPDHCVVSARTALEAELVGIWRDLLQVADVGVTDDFFDLGGHSLLAVRLAGELESRLGHRLPLPLIVANPTVERLAAAITTCPEGDVAIASLASTGLPAEALTDVELDADITPTPRRPRVVRRTRRTLLTGATGFVGTHLLAELVATGAGEVTCLVRSTDHATADRLRKNFTRYGLPTDLLDAVQTVPVDLARPRFGLDEDGYAALAASCDRIYHSAAEVSLVRDYAGLRPPNVTATREILRLAAAGGSTPVHYVSTLSVAPPRVIMPTVPEEFLAPHAALWNGYAQTKWVAEQLVHRAATRGLPARVYRLARVIGAADAGFVNGHDSLTRALLAGIRIGALPRLAVAEMWTPVDFVARAIVRLSESPPPDPGVYNLATNRPVSLPVVADWIREYGFPVADRDLQQWRAELSAAGLDNPLLEMFDGGAAEFTDDLSGLSIGRVAHDHVVDALAGTGLHCPDVDRDLIFGYLDHCVRTGLLPAPGAGRGRNIAGDRKKTGAVP